MNSRDRVLTTLRHQQADRVPIAEMWIDPQVVRAIVPEARDSNDLVEHLGLDMVTVPTMIDCIKHTDGDIRKIMDQLVGIGVDALGPLQDVPGMELDKILDRYPGRITLMGNLNVDLLGRGSVEEVIAATGRLLREVSAKGPHIMSSGNTIASCVRPENYLAVVRTTQEFARYPIDVGQVDMREQ